MDSLILLVGVLLSSTCWAQSPAGKSPAAGRVHSEEALLYSDPNFDSRVLRQVPQGTRLQMSNRLFGAFYRVRLPDGTVGFMTDVDVKPLKSGSAANKSGSPEVSEKSRLKPTTSLSSRRYRGGGVHWLNLREDTMEAKRQGTMLGYAIRFWGENLLGPGSYPMDMSVQLFPQAPGYYSDVTQKTASGFLVLAESLLLTGSSSSKTTSSNFGFGPFLRYSRFEVSLPGSTTTYSLEDVILGVFLGAGVGVKWGAWHFRLDPRYYFERQQYWGLQLGVLHGF